MHHTAPDPNLKALEAALASARALVASLEAALAEVRQVQRCDLSAPAEWLTTAGVAELICVHRKTVERRARNGELPARKLGHDWRFRRSDLDKYLEDA